MNISSNASIVLKEIYQLTECDGGSTVHLRLYDISNKLAISHTMLTKCLYYLKEKELIDGAISHGEPVKEIKIHLTAKGIDTIEH